MLCIYYTNPRWFGKTYYYFLFKIPYSPRVLTYSNSCFPFITNEFLKTSRGGLLNFTFIVPYKYSWQNSIIHPHSYNFSELRNLLSFDPHYFVFPFANFISWYKFRYLGNMIDTGAVSYTHLDVYKRQLLRTSTLFHHELITSGTSTGKLTPLKINLWGTPQGPRTRTSSKLLDITGDTETCPPWLIKILTNELLKTV